MFKVWSVKLEGGQLVTASYDCTVCFLSIQENKIMIYLYNSSHCTTDKKSNILQSFYPWLLQQYFTIETGKRS